MGAQTQAGEEEMYPRKETVLRELAQVAFGDASDETGAKVKMGSKLKALELLGKHFGLFERESAAQEQAVIVDDVQ